MLPTVELETAQRRRRRCIDGGSRAAGRDADAMASRMCEPGRFGRCPGVLVDPGGVPGCIDFLGRAQRVLFREVGGIASHPLVSGRGSKHGAGLPLALVAHRSLGGAKKSHARSVASIRAAAIGRPRGGAAAHEGGQGSARSRRRAPTPAPGQAMSTGPSAGAVEVDDQGTGCGAPGGGGRTRSQARRQGASRRSCMVSATTACRPTGRSCSTSSPTTGSHRASARGDHRHELGSRRPRRARTTTRRRDGVAISCPSTERRLHALAALRPNPGGVVVGELGGWECGTPSPGSSFRGAATGRRRPPGTRALRWRGSPDGVDEFRGHQEPRRVRLRHHPSSA